MGLDFSPLILSFILALLTVFVLLILGIPLAAWLALTKNPIKWVIDPIISLPLVLPPTVLGFYLLLLLSPAGPIGQFVKSHFDLTLVFTFWGILLGSIISSLPFMINPLKSAIQAFPQSQIESSLVLGKTFRQTFFNIILPQLRYSIISAAMMVFAHTLGEFGVVLMVGGNIPQQTRTASMAIYSEVENLNYPQAHVYALILLVFSFVILCLINWFQFISKNNRLPIGLK